MTRLLLGSGLLLGLVLGIPAHGGLGAQETIPGTAGVDLAVLRTLRIPPLEFAPPIPDSFIVDGVPAFLISDQTLPIVRLYARIRGGYGHLRRDQYGVATALPLLLRSSGTASTTPDSVDLLMEALALETTFGTNGTATTSTLDVLTRELQPGLDLWVDLMARPRFDSLAVESWRARELDSVRRFRDDPGRLAISRFNRLMYGDHSIGWEMGPEDLTRGRINPGALRDLHGRLFCRGHLVLGAAGDLTREQAEVVLGQVVRAFPVCPDTLPRPARPEVRARPGTFLIPRDTEQSVLILAHASDVRRDTTAAYFAAQVANSILGASGFSSRLLSRVRTEEGLAYSASSFWTSPTRYQGIVGATTRTGAAQTLEALALVREILGEVRDSPPSEGEVRTAVDQIANGFVFNFQTPGQIVTRQMVYRAQGLPPDWLETYLRGIQGVTQEEVAGVLAREIRPDELVVLIVGDPDRFPGGLAALGDVVIWPESDPVPPGG